MATLSDEPGEGGGEPGAVDAETALARIRERGERVAEREVEQALTRLRARGDVSEREQEAVETLAEGLTEQLLAVPGERLRDADGTTARVALELFGD